MNKACAIFTSDWHIWHYPPVFRSEEENWYKAMARPFFEIKKYQKEQKNLWWKEDVEYDIPVLVAGDIFDHYNPIPQAINFVLERIPENCFGVPGQHDLENHVLENIEKTAFWTLVKVGKIRMINQGDFLLVPEANLEIYFSPWGGDIENIKPKPSPFKKVLVMHKYVWFDEKTRYGGTQKPSGQLSGLMEQLQKFDVAVFGDNHIPFRCKIGNCQVVNCGTLLKRKRDERDYKTGFCSLMENGEIEFHPFDTSKDKYFEVEDPTKDMEKIDAEEFLNELNSLNDCEVDYRQNIENAIHGKSNGVKKVFAQIFNEYEQEKK